MSTTATLDVADHLIEELAVQADAEARQRTLSRFPERLSSEFVLQLADRSRERVRKNVNEALALAEAAIHVSQQLADVRTHAYAVRSKANALYAMGRYRESIELHDQALAGFESVGDQNEIGRSLSGSILPLYLSGDYDRAFAAVARARNIFADNPLRLARLDINTGNIYYRQDRFQEALDYYNRAYDVVLAHEDREGIGVVLGNLATCLISIGDFEQALKTNEHARDYCESHGMPLLRAQAEYNIAYLYYLRGDYSRAVEMLRSTRVTCEQIGDRYHYALCNLDLSELYLELNLSTEAAELARAGHSEFDLLKMGYEAAKCLAFEAIALGQQGQAFQSLKLFAQARTIFVREGNQVWPSLIDLYQAMVLFQEGRHFEARRLARAAVEVFDRSVLHGKAVVGHLLLARIAQRTNDVATAHRECASAIAKITELELPLLKHQAYLLMGQIHSVSGNTGEAYQCFCVSREALEHLRTNLRGQELKLSFLKNRLEVYELLVETCLKRSQDPASLQEAFQYIEESKSRTLMDQMIQSAAPISEDGGQSDLVRRMRSLRDELNWYYSLIELEQLRPEQRSPEHIQRLQTQVRARETDLIRVLHETNASGGDRQNGGQRISLDDIRAAIDPETLILEFFQSGDRILVCLLDRERLQIVPVTLASRINNVLRLLQFQLSKFRLGHEYAQAFRDPLIQSTNAHLKALYDELLVPVLDRIGNQHLLFVPHGALHYVPFHALFDGKQYVIDNRTISYAPSASIFALCARKEVNRTGAALLMGVPDQNAPSIVDELQALSGIVEHPKVFIGNSASEYVLRSCGPSARIIHIATHGYFRQDSPMFSSIRLGNSYLSLYDLYQLRLPVELVTFSGCATGLNVVAAGDELIGLARGLFQAGAQSLLLSLWDVHDQSTAEFMTAFYRKYRGGEDKAAAVRAAMMQVRESYPHPYQWAPFVLMGKYKT